MINVMVTAVGGGGVGEQILKALRLSNDKYHIVGADMQKASKGLYEVDKSVLLPPAIAHEYIESLFNVCKQEEIDVLLFGSEAEIKKVSPSRALFEELGIFMPLNSQEILDLCFNKLATMEWLELNGFAAPKTILVNSFEDLDRICEFPIVLKPHLVSGGSTNVFIAQNEAERDLFGRYLLVQYDSFIAQQYIGTPQEEYTVGVLLDMEGHLINSIALRKNILTGFSNKIKIKNRTNNAALGDVLAISNGISQGAIGCFEDVTRQCEEIALKMGCVGAINIQCRFVNGVAYIFEINPRFSGTTSLRALVGYNEPEILIAQAIYKREPTPRFHYGSGVVMRGINELLVEL